jgi:hypothetical protein
VEGVFGECSKANLCISYLSSLPGVAGPLCVPELFLFLLFYFAHCPAGREVSKRLNVHSSLCILSSIPKTKGDKNTDLRTRLPDWSTDLGGLQSLPAVYVLLLLRVEVYLLVHPCPFLHIPPWNRDQKKIERKKKEKEKKKQFSLPSPNPLVYLTRHRATSVRRIERREWLMT